MRVCVFIQIKHKQDEEKRQLCSLRDQLRPALQPEFKEVKNDTFYTSFPLRLHTHFSCFTSCSNFSCLLSPLTLPVLFTNSKQDFLTLLLDMFLLYLIGGLYVLGDQGKIAQWLFLSKLIFKHKPKNIYIY